MEVDTLSIKENASTLKKTASELYIFRKRSKRKKLRQVLFGCWRRHPPCDASHF
jgi:hypothetical protein